MQLLRWSAVAFLVLAYIPGASALMMQDSSTLNKSGASFNDPDENNPYQPMDKNSVPSNLQDQTATGNPSLTPASGTNPPDTAFKRAQQRMQQ